jgi:hypothetical protein
MGTKTMFSSYGVRENRVTASMLGVFERIDLPIVEYLLGSLSGDASLPFVSFVNQLAKGGDGVPDGAIEANFRYLFEVKVERNTVDIPQLRRHLARFRGHGAERLFVVTPDVEPPPVLEEIPDDRLSWFSFDSLSEAINELFRDAAVGADEDGKPVDVPYVSEHARFLLRELDRFLDEEGLVGGPDTLIVAAKFGYDEYVRFHAYACRPGTFTRGGIARLGFYTNKVILPEFPRILARTDDIVLSEVEILRLQKTGLDSDALLADRMQRLLANKVRADGDPMQLLALSPPNDPSTLCAEAGPIPHNGRGAWIQKGRYLDSSRLRSARSTNDL